jgi:NMD protein affecting ribosome stability and mRNA decay
MGKGGYMEHCCMCGRTLDSNLQHYCTDCFFNLAVEGPDADFIRHPDNLITVNTPDGWQPLKIAIRM